MNRALIYLWVCLLKRKLLHWLRCLRRPTTLIGFGAVAFFLGCLFYYRHAEIFAQLVGRETLIGGALIMLGGYFVITAVYLRAAWDLKLVPAFVSSPLTQLLFYPALALSDVGSAPIVSQWTLRFVRTRRLFDAGSLAANCLSRRLRGQR